MDILYYKFLDTALPFISMEKSDASGSTFHRPINRYDVAKQEKVSNNECKLCVSASRSTMYFYFFELVETFLVKLTIFLTFRLSKDC